VVLINPRGRREDGPGYSSLAKAPARKNREPELFITHLRRDWLGFLPLAGKKFPIEGVRAGGLNDGPLSGALKPLTTMGDMEKGPRDGRVVAWGVAARLGVRDGLRAATRLLIPGPPSPKQRGGEQATGNPTTDWYAHCHGTRRRLVPFGLQKGPGQGGRQKKRKSDLGMVL